MDVNLRTAAAGDLAELTAIAHDAKRHWNYPESLIAHWSPTLTFDDSSLVEMHVIVAVVDGCVEGFCGIAPGLGRFQLEHLWIRPRAMGRGLGRTLIECAIDFARSQGAQALLIESEPNAEAFYIRMGAVRVGSIPAPVHDSPDRVLPILEIALGDT